MRSSTVLALFAGSATAQSTAIVLNPLMPTSTLTVIGSSSGTTTYVNSCPDGTGIPDSFFSETASDSVKTSVTTPVPGPSTTAPAVLRRQDNFLGACEPITLKQGSSSMELHMEDPSPGVWTADMNCAWKGELTSADLTCTVTNTGSFAKTLEVDGVTIATIMADEISEASVLQTVQLVQPTSNAASSTASGSAPSATASGSSASVTVSGSGAPAQATGAAAMSFTPGSVMAFAGVFAAALAL